MRVAMEVRRVADRYEGSLTREGDDRRLYFVGTLELMAALERLQLDDTAGEPASTTDEERTS